MSATSLRWSRCMSAIGLAAALAACSESPQALTAMPKSDTAPATGTGVTAFTASGWQAGDAKSWSEQLKARAQYGMNDHTRSP